MFQPIIHNTDDPLIKRYNCLIAKKPKTGTVAEKIAAQRDWRKECEELLNQIRNKKN